MVKAQLHRGLRHAKWVAASWPPRAKRAAHFGDSTLAKSYGTRKFDLVLSSPPYLSRLDYIRFSEPELRFMSALGLGAVGRLRGRQVGSVLVSSKAVRSRSLPPQSKSFVQLVERHPSKGSRNYYRKFIANYFGNLQIVAKHLVSSTRPGADAWIVVQDSWYKDIRIPTGDLAREIFQSAGWNLRRRWAFKVKSSLSGLAATTHGWRRGSPLMEHVLKFGRN